MNSNNTILKQAGSIGNELIKLRRMLHSQPELGFEEYKTSEFIADYLDGLGLEVKTGIAKTGVIAVLRGDLPGSTIALRADMDALPVNEETELEYKSEIAGRMHACGHDAHTAILLGASRLLLNSKSRLKGTVKFIFQPAEEYAAGAKSMIDEGVLRDPDVDIAVALHILPDIESGHVGLKEGAVMSSVDEFEIGILGKGGHGANPQNTIDPIITGAQLAMSLQTIVSRRLNPGQPAVLSICKFNSGTKSNIIPSAAYLSGTVRCQDDAVRISIIEQMRMITEGVCNAAGAGYELKINEMTPVAVNNGKIFNDFLNRTLDIIERDKIELLDKPFMYSEDFAFFAKAIPSLCFFLGTYNEDSDCIYPLHSSRYKIDEDIMPLGAALLANYCLQRSL